MKTVFVTAMLTLIGLTAQAQNLNSLSGVYRTVNGGTYCKELSTIEIKVDRDTVSILNSTKSGFQYSNVYEGVNDPRPVERIWMNAISHERTVYEGGTLKTQSKFFFPRAGESSYKDDKVMLRLVLGGYLLYHFFSYGDTFCLMKK